MQAGEPDSRWQWTLILDSLCALYNLLLRCHLSSQPAKVTKSPTIPKESKKQTSLLSYHEQRRARKQPSGSLRVHTHSLCSHCLEVHCPRVVTTAIVVTPELSWGRLNTRAPSGLGNNHILLFVKSSVKTRWGLGHLTLKVTFLEFIL